MRMGKMNRFTRCSDIWVITNNNYYYIHLKQIVPLAAGFDKS